jgi:Leucine-rich repeat (LRR) protein
LAGLTNLETLILNDNKISDITPLVGLTNLKELRLNHNEIADITLLAGLTNLEHLRVKFNEITDITPLAGLTNLKHLQIRGNKITDLSPISGLTNLEYLRASRNPITDLTPLAGLIKLETLRLSNCSITDITPLAGLTDLNTLRLGNNNITDFAPLAEMTGLEYLALRDNQISNLTPLAWLTNLKALDLRGNQISDLTPLSKLTDLEWLSLHRNPLCTRQTDRLQTVLSLPPHGISHNATNHVASGCICQEHLPCTRHICLACNRTCTLPICYNVLCNPLTLIPFTGEGWSFAPTSGTLTITTNAGTTNWRNGRGTSTFRILDVRNVVIQSGVTTIGDNAFWDCTNLESIAIPNGITSIGNNAFRGCTRLTSITIPNTVTSIGNSAFQYCAITSITIPASVTSIGSWAFLSCTNLIEIIFERATPPSFGSDVFSGCNSLNIIYVPQGSRTAYQAVTQLNSFNIISGTVIYNMQTLNADEFQGLTSGSGIDLDNSVLQRGGSASMQVTANLGIQRTVTVTGRGGTSQGVRMRPNNIAAVAGRNYEIIITGSFATPYPTNARLRFEGSPQREIALSPVNSNGHFTIRTTITGAQIRADGNNGNLYTIGNDGSGTPDMTITGVIIVELN